MSQNASFSFPDARITDHFLFLQNSWMVHLIALCSYPVSIAFKLSTLFKSNWLAFTYFWSKFYDMVQNRKYFARKIFFSASMIEKCCFLMTYFCIIFAEKYFLAKYLRFYTSTTNFIKIRPKINLI